MVLVAFLPLAWVERKEGMISVELLDFLLTPRMRRVSDLAVVLFSITVYAVIAYASWLTAVKNYQTGTFVIALQTKIVTLARLFPATDRIRARRADHDRTAVEDRSRQDRCRLGYSRMNVEVGFYGVGILLLLLLLRVPVALAMIAVSFGGIASLLGIRPALGIVTSTPYSFVASWTMSAVPMFLLMGFVAFHAGLTASLFGAAKAILWRVPGGLAISSIFACTGFATVSGSSIACAAAMGRIAIPEMVAAGYRPSFAAGSIAAGGTIGALIPPSILMIIYGVFAETSITQVFIGGIGVGLLTAFVLLPGGAGFLVAAT
jgi:hypothetical protein